MNELIKVTVNSNNEQAVSGRVLHEFLEVETPYTMWFNRMSEYGFDEAKDYVTILLDRATSGIEGIGKGKTDHAITLDIAKEISMIQRTPKGKEARQYFITIEKAYRDRIATHGSLSVKERQANARIIARATTKNLPYILKALDMDTMPLCASTPAKIEENKLIGLDDFIVNRCILTDTWQKAGELHQAYRDYCVESKILPVKDNVFKKHLTSKGFEWKRIRYGAFYHGLAIAN